MKRAYITSPVVGSLALLHVENDAVVAAGESIGEVESMKMFITLSAPIAGRVHWLVDLGQIVSENDPIAEIVAD